MSSDKTVVLLTPGFARDEQDSTCLPFLQEYVQALQKHEACKIVAIQYPFDRKNYHWKGIPVYSAQGKNARYFSRVFTWIKVWTQLFKLHRKEKIAVLHTFWLTEATFIAQLFGWFTGVKIVAYAIGQDSIAQNRYLKRIRFKNIVVVAMSVQVQHNLAEQNIYCNKVISQGINRDKLVKPQPYREYDIVGIGSLSPLKNYSLFIDVVAALKRDLPGVKAMIIGDGEERVLLAAKIKNLQLQKNVVLKGNVPHSEVFHHLGNSKVLLHTSAFEGQSTVMLEALAMGLDVVCFDVGRLDCPKKIFPCASKEEMMVSIGYSLKNNRFEPVIHSMEDTVKAFLTLYEA